MREFIKYIQTMQGALIGLFFISCIVASIVILGISIYKIAPIILKYLASNNEQYERMKTCYPELKQRICELKLSAERAQNHPLFTGITSSVDRYIYYEKDPERYRWLYPEELPMMDSFLEQMRDVTGKLAELCEYFLNHTMPLTPVFRPFLKRRVGRMLSQLYRYALMWYVYNKKEVSMDVLHEQFVNYHRKMERRLKVRKLDRYLAILDHWYAKY